VGQEIGAKLGQDYPKGAHIAQGMKFWKEHQKNKVVEQI
jgi:hypothetical protein